MVTLCRFAAGCPEENENSAVPSNVGEGGFAQILPLRRGGVLKTWMRAVKPPKVRNTLFIRRPGGGGEGSALERGRAARQPRYVTVRIVRFG